MSPAAGFVLLEEIAPRLRCVIPQAVKPVGSEDAEELVQDALAIAAKMLHDLEARGKEVTPGNICHYTMLLMKSGRRSYGSGRTGVMSPGSQLDGRSCVLSMEDPAGIDPVTGEEIPLGDMLCGRQIDPSIQASRRIDWEQFLDIHDDRYAVLITDMVAGKTALETARHRNESYSCIRQLKEKLADDLREYFGEQAIADSLNIPVWHGNIAANHEKATCRADRRRH